MIGCNRRVQIFSTREEGNLQKVEALKPLGLMGSRSSSSMKSLARPVKPTYELRRLIGCEVKEQQFSANLAVDVCLR